MQFAGAIDNLGGELLAWLTRTVGYWGNIASVGLAGGAELDTTVMPFILRGVSLLGINSSATPRAVRRAVWDRIATDLMPRHFDHIVTQTIEFDELPGAFRAHLDGLASGRTVVRIAGAPASVAADVPDAGSAPGAAGAHTAAATTGPAAGGPDATGE